MKMTRLMNQQIMKKQQKNKKEDKNYYRKHLVMEKEKKIN